MDIYPPTDLATEFTSDLLFTKYQADPHCLANQNRPDNRHWNRVSHRLFMKELKCFRHKMVTVHSVTSIRFQMEITLIALSCFTILLLDFKVCLFRVLGINFFIEMTGVNLFREPS